MITVWIYFNYRTKDRRFELILSDVYIYGMIIILKLYQALWQAFPTDRVAMSVDTQFTWAGAFMFSPVLSAGAVRI